MHIATLTVSQSGEDAPEVNLFWNGTSLPLEFSDKQYDGVGNYSFKINYNILNSGTPAKWYIANSESQKYAVTYDGQNIIRIQSFEADTTPKDSVMGGCEVEIHI
jgi:hypothetical protein